MKGYHLVYKKENFSKELLDALKHMGTVLTLEGMFDFMDFIRKHYKIEAQLHLRINEQESPLNEGVYIDKSKEIIFYKYPSLITFLHEIRHYIQFNTKINELELDYDDKEEEARAWSSSLFYSVFPDIYIDLCNKNMIKYK